MIPAALQPGHAWRALLEGAAAGHSVERIEAAGRRPTLRAGGVYLHSRYNPEEEAARLLESAGLDADRPVLVFGLGLGYHVQALRERGFRVTVCEPDAAVARAAMQGPFDLSDVPLALGDAESVAALPALRALAEQVPQILLHPPTLRLHEAWTGTVLEAVVDAALRNRRLRVAIVGPMFGGSQPLLDYLTRAFAELGHTVLPVDNASGWPVYDAIYKGIKAKRANQQLTAMAGQLMAEWSYARVVEFEPEIAIVLAQAPVGASFAQRLRQRGVLTAFWYVENWRHMPYWRDICPHYDTFFHIQPGPEFETRLEEAGCAHHVFVQTACDPTVHRPVALDEAERTRFGCDISFAGAAYVNRLSLFGGLTDYDFKLWGVGWSGRELSRLVQDRDQRFDNEKFMRIIAGTKVNLNLHSSTASDGVDAGCDALNPRVFEIAAAGGFQVCDPCRGLERHFDPETEVPTYNNLAELRACIDRFLADPDARAAHAQRAHERALAEHTYTHRAQQMLDALLGTHGLRLLRRGVRVQRTVGEVAARLPADSPLRAWLETLPADELFLDEPLREHLGEWTSAQPEAAKVFRYLHEVRSFAETLLKERA